MLSSQGSVYYSDEVETFESCCSKFIWESTVFYQNGPIYVENITNNNLTSFFGTL